MLRNDKLVASRLPSRILLVDDDTNMLALMKRMLTQAGHDVVSCNGFETAKVHLANGFRPDLLLTDVVLHGSTGKRVAAAVQEVSPKTRVVFISGYGNVAVGGQPVLQKPFTRQELVEIVDQVLSASSATGAHQREEAFMAARKKRH